MEQKVMEPEVILVVGQKGSGKSTWVAQKYLQHLKRNVLVLKHKVNIHDKAFLSLTEKTTSNFRQGVPPGAPVRCKMKCSSKEEFSQFLYWAEDNYRHGVLVCDDTKTYFKDRPSEQFLDFLIMNRHMAFHIVLLFQSLTAIPAEVFDYAQKIVLFRTTGNPKRRKEKITDYEALMYAHKLALQNSRSTDKRYTPVILQLEGGVAD